MLFVFLGGAFLFTATPRTRKEFLPRQSLLWLRGRTIGALRAERQTLTSAEWTSCSASHELLSSHAFLLIVLRSAQHPQIPRFLQIFRVFFCISSSSSSVGYIGEQAGFGSSEVAAANCEPRPKNSEVGMGFMPKIKDSGKAALHSLSTTISIRPPQGLCQLNHAKSSARDSKNQYGKSYRGLRRRSYCISISAHR